MPPPGPRSSVPALVSLGALLGAFLAALLPAARAGDEAETPGARWSKAAAAFPAPSAEKGFDWEADFLVEGATFGSARLAAAPAMEGETAVWKTTLVLTGLGGLKMEMNEVLSRSLESLRGDSRKEAGGRTETLDWEKTAAGPHRVRLRKGEDPAIETTVDGAGRLLVSMATGLLALRLLPADAAEYEVTKLDADAETADGILQTSGISVKGVAKSTFQGKEREAWLVEVRTGGETVRIGLDPATRNLIAVESVEKPFAFVPKGQGKAATKVDLTQPAKTPQAAALRTALALFAGDKDLLSAAIHWPTVTAAIKAEAGDEGKGVDDATLKADILENLRPRGERAAIEPILLALVDALKTERLENGRTVVRFPASFGGLALETGEIDGVWYVLKFPSN